MDVVRVNGQIWIREYVPDLGTRYVRLVRAPRSDRNVSTLEQLTRQGDIEELAPVARAE